MGTTTGSSGAALQSTPRQGTEIRTARPRHTEPPGYNPRPVRGRKCCWAIHPVKQLLLQSTPRQGTEMPHTGRAGLTPGTLQSTPRQGTEIMITDQRLNTNALQSTPRQGTEILWNLTISRYWVVTIHAPSGDGNIPKDGFKFPIRRYNPRPVRGRQSRMVHMIMSYNSYLARGRKQNKMHTLISVLIWKQAPLGDGHGVSCEHKNIGEPSQLMPC